jgi:CRISPR-associated protein Csx17
MNTIRMTGCAPVPLAHYLKALAILRLISEQRDDSAMGYWQGDTFVLDSVLDESALLHFFLHEYSPTPIVDPWNGGSGFYLQERKLNEIDPATGKKTGTGVRDQPTTATKIVDQLISSQGHRLARYRGVLNMAKSTVNRMGLSEAPADLHKRLLIEKLRNELPDDSVCGIDSGLVLLESRVSYPPLLGTGWNDGRTDFASNFMQRLSDVLDINSDAPTRAAEKWLRAALFGESVAGLLGGAAIGQFFPAAAGGDNSSSGFRAESLFNPWDFILMIEGAVVFAGAALKRLESADGGTLSAPFCVKPAGVGYATATQADELSSSARPEMWMPLWNAPSGFSELRALMSEGRAQVAGRPARNGVDFARAIASLGVDRGIAAFQRYGFQVRNGLAYFATPLDRLPVTRNIEVDLLNDFDAWLDSFRRAATADSAPSSAGQALRQLESAILALCKQGDAEHVQDVLVALGGCEQAMAHSLKWTEKSSLKPISPLSPRWLQAADDCSAEYRLAGSLASVYGKYGDTFMPLRSQLEPIKCGVKNGSLWVGWEQTAVVDVAWREGDVVDALNAVMARRLVLAQKAGAHIWPDTGRCFASLSHVSAFGEGRMNFVRFADLLWGLALLDWPQIQQPAWSQSDSGPATCPGAVFTLLKLCFAGTAVHKVEVPLVPGVHQRAAIGQGAAATQLAVRRLRASGLAPAVEQVHQQGEAVARAAAALLFPISSFEINALAEMVLRPQATNI